ncbi:MAG: hypothetical protein GY887_11050 [Halieaceae bacterium]|nr:hypothetical protein [Halieaceae bacterium]
MKTMPPEEEITALVGHEFPGGDYTIEHWENFLLTGCTGAEPLPDGIAHPVALFHVPLYGANTSIGDMFSLGQAESDLSVIPEYYDWEIFSTLREAMNYKVTGKIIAAERRENSHGQKYDWLLFQFDMVEPDGTLAARTSMAQQFTRNTL